MIVVERRCLPMSNSNNQELTFEEAVEALSKKKDDGNIDPPEPKLPHKTAENNVIDRIL